MDLDILAPEIAAGDERVFGQWMSVAEPILRSRLRSFAVRVDVEAVLQEALLRVWQVAPRFEPDGEPNGLLRLAQRIAHNLAISEIRRARATPSELETLERAVAKHESSLEPSPPDPLLRRVITLCVEKLPRKPLRALRERLTSAGAEPDQVLAERLNMRLNTFLQNFGRARKLLLQCLEANGVAVEGLTP